MLQIQIFTYKFCNEPKETLYEPIYLIFIHIAYIDSVTNLLTFSVTKWIVGPEIRKMNCNGDTSRYLLIYRLKMRLTSTAFERGLYNII